MVLSGGGALGAYQAGVYEGMSEQRFAPDWVAGVSIGAINAALIAGNPAERRIERLVNPDLSQGLPAFLTQDPGLCSGLMMVQIAAASLVAESRSLATPASIQSIPIGTKSS